MFYDHRLNPASYYDLHVCELTTLEMTVWDVGGVRGTWKRSRSVVRRQMEIQYKFAQYINQELR